LLHDDGDRFAEPIRRLFIAWIAALNAALLRAGVDEPVAWHMAEDTVAAIQGGMLLSAATRNEAVFSRTLHRLRIRLETLFAELRPQSH
jgi:Transcriptional regulator LmrA/YxaF-like, C-terminal domain